MKRTVLLFIMLILCCNSKEDTRADTDPAYYQVGDMIITESDRGYQVITPSVSSYRKTMFQAICEVKNINKYKP